jgi:hypothetical protein
VKKALAVTRVVQCSFSTMWLLVKQHESKNNLAYNSGCKIYLLVIYKFIKTYLLIILWRKYIKRKVSSAFARIFVFSFLDNKFSWLTLFCKWPIRLYLTRCRRKRRKKTWRQKDFILHVNTIMEQQRTLHYNAEIHVTYLRLYVTYKA